VKAHKRGSLLERRALFFSLDYSRNDHDLARKLNLTHNAIYYWRHKLGHKPHPKGNPHNKNKPL